MQTDKPISTLSAAHDSVAYLRQGMDLLRGIGDEHYLASMPPVYASTVGAHMRHIIDHFRCLIDGVDRGMVDYDRRTRDPVVESQRSSAIHAMQDIVRLVETLAGQPPELSLRVKMDCGGPAGNDSWSESSLAREMQFLTSHTIHHYALVAAILDHAGCSLPAGFGVSPSTLNYERQRQAQAR